MEHLAFRENASRGADAIVYLHGGGISGRMWHADLQALSEFYCLAPDLPGHGNSADIRPFSLEKSVEGVAQLVRAQVPSGRASLVGFSVGTVVSVALCNRYPELVEKAFLSGPTPRIGRIASSLMNILSRPLLSLVGAKQRANLVARSLGLSEEQAAEFSEDLENITPGLVAEINDVVAGQPDPHPGGPPAVVFFGEKEFGSTKERARELAVALGDGNVHLVPGLGHAWCLEDPELFRRTVRRWMSGADFGDGFVVLPV